MAEVAPAPADVAPAPTKPKAAKVKTKPQKRVSKPGTGGESVSARIVKAVAASNQRTGLSLAALKKMLAAGGYDVDKNRARIKIAIKKLLENGTLVHTKGTGASGSFKLSKKWTQLADHRCFQTGRKTDYD
uniref:H15 domain-containing protein n=1 Tax=Sphaeramia orbicularis TaxID=375764 RepID=A0A672ZI13_9TELE